MSGSELILGIAVVVEKLPGENNIDGVRGTKIRVLPSF